MPLIRPSTYSDKDLQDLCDTLADTENAIFVLTSIIEESYGKLRPGKREQKLTASCESLATAYSSIAPGAPPYRRWPAIGRRRCGAEFAPGAEAALLARCGEDQFLLKNEIDKLAALSGYGTITAEMMASLGTVTLDADTFDMVKLVAAGRTDQAQQKLKTLLALQNKPIMITGALIGNYIDMYRVLQGQAQPPQPGRCGQGFWLRWQVELPPGRGDRTHGLPLQAPPIGKMPGSAAKAGHRFKKQQVGRRPADAESAVRTGTGREVLIAETGTSRPGGGEMRHSARLTNLVDATILTTDGSPVFPG